MASRDEMLGVNYLTAKEVVGLDDDFIYEKAEPGKDYYQFPVVCDGNRYIFNIELTSDFPYSSPKLMLIEPKVLNGYHDDRSLEKLGSSHDFHLNGRRGDDIDICYDSSSWSSNSCISLLILKAMLWCACYHKYLSDGKNIDWHLNEIMEGLSD